jgi:signal peptidase II
VAVLWISLVIVILDQLTKFAVKGSPVSWLPFEGMPYGSSKPLLGDILRITFIENPGIAFGITLPGFKAAFGVFSIVASIAIVWYLNKHKNDLKTWEKVSLALILGGAVGNLIDRVFYGVIYGYESLFYGRVVDFLDFGYKENWWPVFNIADSGVSVGVVLLMILLLKKKEPVVVTETSSSSVSDASSPQSIEDHTEITSDPTASSENTPQHAQ